MRAVVNLDIIRNGEVVLTQSRSSCCRDFG